jgi:hypothetical protein
MVERDSNGRLKPGSVLNAKGRPHRVIDEATITLALEGAVPLAVVLGKLAAAVRKGDMTAIRLYLSYRWGNPVDNIDANGEMIIRFMHDGIDGTPADIPCPPATVQEQHS